jgi:hypothetical protein
VAGLRPTATTLGRWRRAGARGLACAALVSCTELAGLDALTFEGAAGAGGGAAGGGGAGGAGGEVVFRDDELEGEFELGTMDHVGWSEKGCLALESGRSSGTFTSRVFDAQRAVAWSALEWEPDAPYGKPLPNDGASEAGYRNGNALMSENLLLLHLEGAAGEVAQGTVFDASPMAQTVQVLNDAGEAMFAEGVFDAGLADRYSSALRLVVDEASGFRFGASDYTFAIWARTSETCEWPNKVYMGTEENISMDRDHLWMGCTAAMDCVPPGPIDEGRLHGTHQTTDMDATRGECGPKRINDGAWHHVALVKTGDGTTFPQPIELRYYVDGRLDSLQTAVFGQAVVLEQGPPYFMIGSFPTPMDEFQAEADFDEAVVFRRALPAAEVAGLHARGALRLEVRVRACQHADCSDDPPWALSFVDPAASLGPPANLPLDALGSARFVQYQLAFESLDVTVTGPALYSITLRGA